MTKKKKIDAKIIIIIKNPFLFFPPACTTNGISVFEQIKKINKNANLLLNEKRQK